MTHALRTHGGRAIAAETADVRPAGLGLVGLLTIILGAWGALVPLIGPLFGYRSHGQPAWQWSNLNGLLYVVPGAVAVLFGLILLGRFRAVRRGAIGFAGLVIAACGAWFVLGPALWPTFGSGVVFAPGMGAMHTFIREVGYNLGVGVILAALGGMAMKALAKDRMVLRQEQVARADAEPVGAEAPVRAEGPVRAGEPVREVDSPAVEQTTGYAQPRA